MACPRMYLAEFCPTLPDRYQFAFGSICESFLQNAGKAILSAWYPSSVMLAKNLFAIANQFGHVGSGNAFLE